MTEDFLRWVVEGDDGQMRILFIFFFFNFRH